MMRVFLLLLVLSYPSFGAEQYTETACILLKQQISDYERRLGRKSPLYEESKVNFDTHCQKPISSSLKKNTTLSNVHPKQNSNPAFDQHNKRTPTKKQPVSPTTNQVTKKENKTEVSPFTFVWPLLKMIFVIFIISSALLLFRHYVDKQTKSFGRLNKTASGNKKNPRSNSNYSNNPRGSRVSEMSATSSKGFAGEMEVNKGLYLNLDKSEYTIHSDITLPLEDGGTTQVDHVVVSDFGIFVIETKNMTGWIFGKEKQKKWTQVIHRTKHSFQNPLRQNYMHTKTLANLLDLPHEYFKSVVVFTSKAELKTRMPENVGHLDEMMNYILSFNEPVLTEISKTEVSVLIDKIKLESSYTTNSDHVDYLKEKHN